MEFDVLVEIPKGSRNKYEVDHESGRIRLHNRDAASMAIDDRWALDDPPAAAWFDRALDLTWTRDPFDRLLAAHALLRGWRMATADPVIQEQLGARHTLAL